MIRLNPKGSNSNELEINGRQVLFSYQTPVAGWDERGAFRTDVKYSATTTKHINRYLGGADVGRTVPQSYIDGLVK